MDIKKIHENPPYGMIAILFIGAFAALLNNTLLNIALPTIMTEFSVSPSKVQWVTTSYMLVNGILIPASAFFIQRFTNRSIFLWAMGLFTLGTLVSMIAPSFLVLIVGRMLQASGSGLMMPLLMNVILIAFPVERRGTAMGIFGLVMFVAPAIGPTLSGWIIEHYSWRTLFAIILPFGISAFVYAAFRLKNITPNREIKLDIISIILSSVGFGGLLYGFSSVADSGWKSFHVYGTIIIGSISLIIFVIHQMKLKEPMLDFRIYKYPMFALSSVISVTISASMFSGMLLTPLYIQTVREISPFHSGILMLPGAILMGIMSPITGRLFDKFGARTLAITGLTILTVCTYMLSDLTMEDSYFYLMALYTIRMFGMSLVMMPVMTNGLNELPMRANPHGTAMNNTLQQVSGAIGSAIILTIMTVRSNNAGIELSQEVASGELITKYSIEHLALLEGINFSFLISTIFAVVALILALFIKRPVVPSQEVTLEKA
ncbi:DHA2 family efflux MFS transporter permease subunit [Pseudogracilibacillus sp. SO30301A]|uniref:DHA2 family efflux MFS transporter permease subunit n=1 Tax=Pseudogracilibacillus sp. SO30301A TaxID=3098291 RepID=UPI00300E3297